MLVPNQCRAARAWLGWKQENLAERSGVSLSALRDFESGKRTPIKNNLKEIQAAFESAGVQFIFNDDLEPTGISVAPANQS